MTTAATRRPARGAATASAPVVSLPRDGAPPLRLRATPVHRLDACGAAPAITLWAREPVGWAVSVHGAGIALAAAADTLADAAAWLEGMAARRVAPAATRARAPDRAAALVAALAARRAALAFERAAGLALADWPDLPEP